MSTDHAPDDLQPADRASGFAILAGIVLTLAFVAFHPTVGSRRGPGFVSEVMAKSVPNGVVHGALIALVGVLVAGYSGLASRLGMASLVVRAGLVAYAIGAAGWVAAALINGFITPSFISRYAERPPGDLEAMRHLLALGWEANQASSRLAVLAMSVAVACWSLAMSRRGHLATGALGGAASLLLSAALLSGHLPMDVHGVMAFGLVQAIWGGAVATLLIRGRV